MDEIQPFIGLVLRGGYRIASVRFTGGPLIDPIGREAVAQTRISGNEFRLLMRSGLSDEELSVTLYHEVLEAATVASSVCPNAVARFNEGDFERAAWALHRRLGFASAENLNQMLQEFGF